MCFLPKIFKRLYSLLDFLVASVDFTYRTNIVKNESKVFSRISQKYSNPTKHTRICLTYPAVFSCQPSLNEVLGRPSDDHIPVTSTERYSNGWEWLRCLTGNIVVKASETLFTFHGRERDSLRVCFCKEMQSLLTQGPETGARNVVQSKKLLAMIVGQGCPLMRHK